MGTILLEEGYGLLNLLGSEFSPFASDSDQGDFEAGEFQELGFADEIVTQRQLPVVFDEGVEAQE